MGDLALLGTCLAAGAAVYVIVITPSWLFMGMNRSCLWQLRDQAFAARSSRLVADTRAVDAFIAEIESLILALPMVTPGVLKWLGNQRAETNEPSRPWFDDLGLADLKPADQERLTEWISETHRIMIRAYFTGSWSGLVVSRTHRGAFKVALRSERWRQMISEVERQESDEIAGLVSSRAPRFTGAPPEDRRRDLIGAL